jgi:hypothetical protein
MQQDKPPVFLVDGVSNIAIHNGVARMQFMRLEVDGKAVPSHEVWVPLPAMKSILEALRKVPTA